MSELVRAVRKAMKHELIQIQEFIANELARFDNEIGKPPNYGNGETRMVPRHTTEAGEQR